jgi:hypothetical protein
MSSIKVNGRKSLSRCECGCNTEAFWHRLSVVRDAERRSYFVLEGCREEFEKELAHWQKIKMIRDALRGTKCWQRWKAANVWWSLQFLVHVRLKGAFEAARIARRDTILLVLPRWAAKLYLKIK